VALVLEYGAVWNLYPPIAEIRARSVDQGLVDCVAMTNASLLGKEV